jgi:iron complex outermembrane receptor protein
MSHTRKALIEAIFAVFAGLLLPDALAQQTTPAPPEETAAPIQEVVVTGSRIPVPANISATSPTTTVSTQDIHLQGQTDTIEVLNSLPQNIVTNADLGNQSNPLTAAGGVATADLRGLGPQRTLVLIDGRRLGIGDPNTQNPNPAPDLDQIPAAMIERIDVVTGGASAVYGSDATAGVINFIMKKNFQGIQIDGQYADFMHDNNLSGIQALDAATAASTGDPAFKAPSGNTTFGARRDLSILMGTNFADNAGNITVYLTYHNQAPVAENRTDYGTCLMIENGLLTGGPLNGFTCLGSSNSNIFIMGPNQTPYSVVGHQFLPYPQIRIVRRRRSLIPIPTNTCSGRMSATTRVSWRTSI